MILIIAVAFLVLTILNLFVGGGLVWLAARRCRIRPTSYWRSLLIYVIAVVAQLATGVACWLIESHWPSTVMVVAGIVLPLGAWFVVIKIMLRARWGRGLLAGLLVFVGNAAVSIAMALAIRATLVEAFSVSAGSMSPGVYGRHVDLTCPTCGYHYASADGRLLRVIETAPAATVKAACPNCGESDTLSPESLPSLYRGIASSRTRGQHPNAGRSRCFTVRKTPPSRS